MLALRPNCELCDVDLPPSAANARICSYECTFCADCVENTLHNVCPNCGGGFAPRPIRPAARVARGDGAGERPSRLEAAQRRIPDGSGTRARRDAPRHTTGAAVTHVARRARGESAGSIPANVADEVAVAPEEHRVRPTRRGLHAVNRSDYRGTQPDLRGPRGRSACPRAACHGRPVRRRRRSIP